MNDFVSVSDVDLSSLIYSHQPEEIVNHRVHTHTHTHTVWSLMLNSFLSSVILGVMVKCLKHYKAEVGLTKVYNIY